MTLPRCTHAPTGAAALAAAELKTHLPRLETKRLVLRIPETRDFPAWAKVFASDDKGHIGGPMSAEEAWDAFAGYIACWILHGHGIFAVERRDTGELVGFVHLGLEWDDFEPELGWIFAVEGRGQGFATEAASAVRDYARDLLGAGAFVSYIAAENTASAKVASRLGAERDPVAEAGGDREQIWRHGVQS